MDINLTERAKRAIALANQEAQRMNCEYIGTEHMLLGVLRDRSGVGRTLLEQLGINLVETRAAIERLVKPGPEMVTMGKLPQTPRLKNVFDRSDIFAKRIGDKHVGTEHIVYGLLAETEGIATQVFHNFKITKERYVKILAKILDKIIEEEIIKSCKSCLSFDVCVLVKSIEDMIEVSRILGVEDIDKIEEKTYELLIDSCPHYKEEKNETD